jgi:prevent-host-death family protein
MRKNVVGSRELKTRLGTYLRRVQEGQTMVVTERGRPVAELAPVHAGGSGDEKKIEELVALGLLIRLSREPLARFKPLRLGGRQLSATILEERGDRF